METLIFIAIAVVITIIQKKMEKAKEEQQRRQLSQRKQSRDEETDRQEHRAPRSLQDLIRQFEESQRQASQGNIEPPTPPVERRDPNKPLTLHDIAEVVIGVDYVNLEFLMEEFNVDENTAAEMLMDLQAHRIVGRDMGEGDCDGLIFSSFCEQTSKTYSEFMAFDKQDGRIVYRIPMKHECWSSPVAFYNDKGEQYIFIGDRTGTVYLIKGMTGEVIASEKIGFNFESSPIVVDNKIIVGSRGNKIFKISLQ